MRIGYRDSELLFDGETFVGVNLGWDSVCEHECGIESLQRDFGIQYKVTRKVNGIDARKITVCPDTLLFQTKKKTSVMAYLPHHYKGDRVDLFDLNGLSTYKDTDFTGAWSGRDFGIKAKNAEKHLTALHEAFKNLDVVFFTGGAGPFSNAGLNICIASRVPEAARQEAISKDIAWLDLEDKVAESGILKRLKQAQRTTGSDNGLLGNIPRCSYYACSPKVRSYFKDEVANRSEYDLIFWLNPMSQDKNNHGWFTVEELDQWIDGKGPIPKK